MQVIQKGIVQTVSAGRSGVSGVLQSGAEFYAYYYGSAPIIGDIVWVTEVADGSWLVVTGPSSAQGLFGVGGDRDITITAATAADPGARTTSADGNMRPGSLTVTSASGAFTSSDVGRIISGGSLRTGTYITAVNSSTSVEVSVWPQNPLTTTATLTITPQNARWTKAASEFSLARDLYCVNLTLDPSDGAFTLLTNGYRIFCLGTLTIGKGIRVHNDGLAAAGGTAGGNARANVVGRAVGAGANAPAAGTPAAGNNAADVTDSAATISTTAKSSGGAGGGSIQNGGTNAVWLGGRGGTVINALTNGWPAAVPDIVKAVGLTGTKFAGGAGGGSGGLDGGGLGTARPGAGGGGGGVLVISARRIVNLGTISASGGAGAAATIGTGTDVVTGGGGGGGGGVVVVVFGAAGSTLGQVVAEGGAAGGGLAGSGGLGTSVQAPDAGILSAGTAEYQPGGGAGGAGVAAGFTAGFNYAQTGLAGAAGLIWALPL